MGSRTLTDAVLVKTTEVLLGLRHPESVSLASNAGLGLGKERGIPYFIRFVGGKLKNLYLSTIPRLRSEDLEGLAKPRANVLSKGSDVRDRAAPFIAYPYLNFLDLQTTKFSGESTI